MVDFTEDDAITKYGVTLKGEAKIIEEAPGNVTRALRIGGVGSYATIDVDINPEVMPTCTLVIALYVQSMNNMCFPVGNDNGGFDRSIGFNWAHIGGGMGIMAGPKSNKVYDKVTNPNVHRWSHMVAVFNQKGTHEFYYNGQKAPNTFDATAGEGTTKLHIGNLVDSNIKFPMCDIWVKDVRVFNRALGAYEVRDLYSRHLYPLNTCGVEYIIRENDLRGKLRLGNSPHKGPWELILDKDFEYETGKPVPNMLRWNPGDGLVPSTRIGAFTGVDKTGMIAYYNWRSCEDNEVRIEVTHDREKHLEVKDASVPEWNYCQYKMIVYCYEDYDSPTDAPTQSPVSPTNSPTDSPTPLPVSPTKSPTDPPTPSPPTDSWHVSYSIIS